VEYTMAKLDETGIRSHKLMVSAGLMSKEVLNILLIISNSHFLGTLGRHLYFASFWT
jgi:hypothetical protein